MLSRMLGRPLIFPPTRSSKSSFASLKLVARIEKCGEESQRQLTYQLSLSRSGASFSFIFYYCQLSLSSSGFGRNSLAFFCVFLVAQMLFWGWRVAARNCMNRNYFVFLNTKIFVGVRGWRNSRIKRSFCWWGELRSLS